MILDGICCSDMLPDLYFDTDLDPDAQNDTDTAETGSETLVFTPPPPPRVPTSYACRL